MDSSLQSKFRASIVKAVPSIDCTRTTHDKNAAGEVETYIMGGFVKITVEAVPDVDLAELSDDTATTLHISIPVYKIHSQEFNHNELSFLISWAQSALQTGQATIQDNEIMIFDELTLECIDNYSVFCNYIDRLFESYWNARKRVLDIKEDLVRQEVQRKKQFEEKRQQATLIARRRKRKPKSRRFAFLRGIFGRRIRRIGDRLRNN